MPLAQGVAVKIPVGIPNEGWEEGEGILRSCVFGVMVWRQAWEFTVLLSRPSRALAVAHLRGPAPARAPLPAPGERIAAPDGGREVAESRPPFSGGLAAGEGARGAGRGRGRRGPRPRAGRGPAPQLGTPSRAKSTRSAAVAGRPLPLPLPRPGPACPPAPARRCLRTRPSCTCPSSRAAGTCAAAAPTCPATGSPGCSCPPRCRSGRASPPRCPAAGTS